MVIGHTACTSPYWIERPRESIVFGVHACHPNYDVIAAINEQFRGLYAIAPVNSKCIMLTYVIQFAGLIKLRR